MKKSNICFLIVLFSVITFSCKEEEESPSNNLSFNGTTSVLQAGFSSHEGVLVDGDEEFNSFEVVLLAEGLSMNADGNVVGLGDAIAFSLVLSADELQEGTYTFNGDDESPVNLSLTDAGVYLNFNPETEEGNVFSDLTGGTVELSKSGETYTVEFTITIDGKAATGRYSGEITIVEDDDSEPVVEG